MEQQEAKRRGLEELRDLRKEFEVMRAEVRVMRQYIEDAVGRWDTVQAPDYSQEFGMVYQSIDQLENRLATVEQSRLVANPNKLVDLMKQISTKKINDQADDIKEVVALANGAVTGIKDVVSSARTRHQQNSWVWGAFLAGFVVSFLLQFVVFPFLKSL